MAGTQAPRLLFLMLLPFLAACTGVINPPVPTVTPIPTVPPTPSEVSPTPTPIPEQWVKNHRITEMWSGPATDRNAILFGRTSNTFCAFRVERTADDARILVFNPYSNGEFWIDVEAVGPVVEPERRRMPKPRDQNCAEAIYEP